MASGLIIKIPISPSLVSPARAWVRRFNKAPVTRVGDALLEGRSLLLDAHDVDFFIRLSNADESSELDAQRLKAAALQAMRDSLKRRKSRSSIKRYYWIDL